MTLGRRPRGAARRRVASRRWPYVRDDIVDGPVFTWTNQEIAELQFPRAIGNCAKTKVRDGKVMKKLRETLPSESWVTKFPWALDQFHHRLGGRRRARRARAPSERHHQCASAIDYDIILVVRARRRGRHGARAM